MKRLVAELLEDGNPAAEPARPHLCAWCKRWFDPAGNYVTAPPDADPKVLGSISHGICPTCYKQQMGEYFSGTLGKT